jgi:hypothetical protein
MTDLISIGTKMAYGGSVLLYGGSVLLCLGICREKPVILTDKIIMSRLHMVLTGFVFKLN